MSRRAVAPLVELLQFHAAAVTQARPCLLVRHARRDGLVVPTSRGRAPEFVGGFGRATVTEAELAGLVVVGTELRGVPEYECDSAFWRWRRGTRGYAIALGPNAPTPVIDQEVTS
ncbi:hypothetical protein ACIP98_21210 [Streptomyces sp. NPDC088354]|uniref:hypothetical protein n=1 Tax=Streptomyces sp. NPDC088354 TaxID=3365856 RepID=UPI0037F60D63